jgi:hypothetical protein
MLGVSPILKAQAAPIPTAESDNEKEELKRRAAVAADNKRLDDLLAARESKTRKAAAAARKKREAAIAKYPPKMQVLIRERRIQVGWVPDAVVLSWGRPEHINRTTYSFGVHEQWVYNMRTYVYFEDGKVTSIQN